MADILYIPDMAQLLGTTEAAIRTRLQRGGDIPPHSKIGSRIVWTRENYNQWLKAKSSKIEVPND